MEFIGDIARKTGKASLLAVEAMKTQKAGEIGKSTGLFYVPKVVNFNSEAGVLEFELLRGLVPLLEFAIRKDGRLFELLEKAGQALAVVHEQLVLPEEMKFELPPEWMGSSDDNVFIHGDFTIGNVGLHMPSERLVILDWSAAPLLGRTPVFGSKYFDILWFVSRLFNDAPYKAILNWNAEEMADTFIRGYAGSDPAEKLTKLKHYWPKIVRLQSKYIRHQVKKQSLTRAVAYLTLRTFMFFKLWRYGRRFS